MFIFLYHKPHNNGLQRAFSEPILAQRRTDELKKGKSNTYFITYAYFWIKCQGVLLNPHSGQSDR